MFEFFRFMHILGVAMFFGSVLAHVTAGLIPGAADSAPLRPLVATSHQAFRNGARS